MGAQGSALLDFGAFPGSDMASVAVADAAILAGSLAEAWLVPATTVDHSVDEHLIESLEVYAASVLAGVGFTVYGVSRSLGDTRLYGKWNVGWVWN